MSSTTPGEESPDNGKVRRKQVPQPSTAPCDSEVSSLPTTSLLEDVGGGSASKKHPLDSVQGTADDAQPKTSTNLGEKSKPSRSRWQLFSSAADEWWIFELLSFVIAFAAAVSLIIVLAHFDGKPQTSWEFGITLNSVVSFLITIAETAAMGTVTAAISQGTWLWFSHNGREGKLADLVAIDSASRGSWGSLTLLWITKGKNIISLGAFLTVVAVLIDPLSQLVLTVEYREVDTTSQHNDTGTVPRAEVFDEFSPGGIEATKNIALPMLAAINNGMYTPGIQPLHVSCPTSHCTWPTNPTIALCGECTDLTSKMTTSCDSDSNCVYTLPNGASISGSSITSLSNVVNSTNQPPLVYTNSTYPYLTHFDVLGSFYSAISLVNVTAFECGLWFCIKAFSISAQGGNQMDSTVGTWDEYAINPLQGSNNGDGTEFIFSTPPSANQTLLNIDPNATFAIDALTVQAMEGAFGSLFTGSVEAGDGEASYSSTVMQAMWNQADIPAWVENIALSITNHIRSTPYTLDENGNPRNITHGNRYNGTVFESVAFVRVRWLWLIYPFTILVLALVFLIAIMVFTRRSHVGAWKSSPLALLFCPLEVSLQGRLEDAADEKGVKGWTATEMEMLADEVNVRVAKGDDGWRFRNVGREN